MAFVSMSAYLDESGNMTETYATCLILVNLGLLLVDVRRGAIGKATCFLSGVVFGGIALLRPNMFGISGAVAILVIADAVRHKSFGRALVDVLCGVAGVAVVALPFMVYYWQKGALYDLYDCYIRYNMAYTFGPRRAPFRFSFDFALAVLLLLVGLVMYARTKGNELWHNVARFNLLFQVLSFVFLGTRTIHSHYYLPYLASCIVPLVWLFDEIGSRLFKKVLLLGLVCVFLPLGASKLYLKCYEVRKFVGSREYGKLFSRRVLRESDRDDVEKLKPYIDDPHSVWVLGGTFAYHGLGVDTEERYFFQPPVRQYGEIDIDDAIVDSLERRKNRYVVLVPTNIRDTTCPWQAALERNYDRIASSGRFQLFTRKSAGSR